MITLGIIGAAHCGSTALNLILDGLPGVAGVGESHWLVDSLPESAPNRDRLRWPCRTCGPDCPILTPELLHELHTAAGPWWPKLSRACRSEVVVSTDKRPIYFERLGHPDVALVLYRRPQNWVASWTHHHPEVSAKTAAAVWKRIYTTAPKWCDGRAIPWHPVCWDDFREDGPGALVRLLAALKLDHLYDPTALDIGARTHHHVWGYDDLTTDRLLGPDEARLSLPDEHRMQIAKATAEVLAPLEVRKNGAE